MAASSNIFGPNAASARSSTASGTTRCVESVEKRTGLSQRLSIRAGLDPLIDEGRVADADSDQEAVTVL